MSVRIATFNAENLFRRPAAFGIENDTKRKDVLDAFRKLVGILDHVEYTDLDKADIVAILQAHGAGSEDKKTTKTIVLNEPRGGAKLLKTESGKLQVKAKGRLDWVGWAELARDDLTWAATKSVAKVIAAVDADVLLVVEIEDRITLDRFNTQVLQGELGARPYRYNLLIDGNDSRGIDVGILSRRPVVSLRSHFSDTKDSRVVFSRDCPEFEVDLGRGEPLWLLGNHFKSKIGGGFDQRLRQAERVAALYRAALERSARVVVAGDLNDGFESPPLSLLLATGLRDAMTHPSYRGGIGTHVHDGRLTDKFDYLMFSPELWDTVHSVGLERRGIFPALPGVTPFEGVKDKSTQASDHAALFADLDL
ncbi:endonuclease/exonuclease/phosphatase family protein [Streptomyces telluris]|uniref:Endonuclease/exonuclease/phosphatase family protein n=1 Tax=Streptomyces telluris TaxID=2720021 RepID=A0A9X2RR37_9ACTN|nr:endonuclease/exonuclease/phosphatase family protein [Streptomyces telluris]MCQ8772890.1 endonuclease/exonuclease/phosphatase family protein [Streptomyces telluris]NJP81571.1 endonuclease/exonuclease/phosphatase family protein [Streptomyces telluris]